MVLSVPGTIALQASNTLLPCSHAAQRQACQQAPGTGLRDASACEGPSRVLESESHLGHPKLRLPGAALRPHCLEVRFFPAGLRT